MLSFNNKQSQNNSEHDKQQKIIIYTLFVRLLFISIDIAFLTGERFRFPVINEI